MTKVLADSYQEWVFSQVALVHDEADRKQIDLCISRVAIRIRMVVVRKVGMEPHFRREVDRCAAPGLQVVITVKNSGKAVIGHFQDQLHRWRVLSALRVVQEDIGWLHVSLDNAVIIEHLHSTG